MGYAFWADVIVAFHGCYVGFVVVGELLIVAGWILRWRWVRNPWFRVVHLLAIAIVAAEAIGQVPCPITVWEGQLRELAGQASSTESFMGRLVHFLFMDGDNPWPEWVYNYLHIGFGVLVLATLLLVPPRWASLKRRRRQEEKEEKEETASQLSAVS
jgi:hypothetical protein